MNKLICTFLIFFSLFLLKASAVVVPTLNLDLIEKEIAALDGNSLVVFDIDYTLIIPKDSILGPCGEHYLQKWIRGVEIKSEQREILSSLIMLQSKVSLIDDKILDLIDVLKHKKIKTVALTAMPTGQYGLIPSMEAWRVKQIGDLGIHFGWSFPLLDHFALDEFVEFITKPAYKQGILGSARYPKGKVLTAFLRKMGWKPSKIIFIDDRLDFIASVEAEIEKESIPLISFHYTAALDKHSHLDIRVADFQLNHLIQNYEWISDERAQQQLSSDLTLHK
ncbi:MAG: DUF2608 domain-containing protein [Chlamydiales bacterium]